MTIYNKNIMFIVAFIARLLVNLIFNCAVVWCFTS